MKFVSRPIGAVLCLSIILSGCATIGRDYPSNSGPQSGGIAILLSRATPQVSVIIDGKLLLDNRSWATRRVNVANVPSGPHNVRVFASSWQLSDPLNFQETVAVQSAGDTPVVVPVPNYSALYWIYYIAIVVVSALPTVYVVYR